MDFCWSCMPLVSYLQWKKPPSITCRSLEISRMFHCYVNVRLHESSGIVAIPFWIFLNSTLGQQTPFPENGASTKNNASTNGLSKIVIKFPVRQTRILSTSTLKSFILLATATVLEGGNPRIQSNKATLLCQVLFEMYSITTVTQLWNGTNHTYIIY